MDCYIGYFVLVGELRPEYSLLVYSFIIHFALSFPHLPIRHNLFADALHMIPVCILGIQYVQAKQEDKNLSIHSRSSPRRKKARGDSDYSHSAIVYEVEVYIRT
jgi:hypothetical protein